MLRRRASLVGFAVLVGVGVVWCATPAQAVAKWSAPKNLFATEVYGIAVGSNNRPALQVRADGAGNAVAAWVENTDISHCRAEWAYRPFGGSWTAPNPLAGGISCLGSGLVLAMNHKGAAVVAWVQGADVVAALRPPGGSFGTPTTMSSGGLAADPAVAINSAGTVAVAWVEIGSGFGSPNLLKARVRPAGGSYSSTEPLSAADTASAPSLAVDPAGNVIALWVRAVIALNTTDYYIETSYRPAGGHFSTTPTQTLDHWTHNVGGQYDVAPDVALDAIGRATAVWGLEIGGPQLVVRSAAKIASSSQFGTTQTVNSGDTGNARDPRVAVDASTNTAVVVWLQCGASCVVRSAVRPSGGAYGSLKTLSGSLPLSGYAPAVAFTSSGAAIAAWSGAPGGSGSDRVAVARRPKGGTFGSATFISGPQGTSDENAPALGVDGHGNAIAVWISATGTPSALVRYADFLASWYQPDGLIKKASASSYSGAFVYNTTGTHQIVSAKVARGHSITFDVKVVNRSSALDTITVKGAGAKTGFTVKYLAGASGSTAITTSVVNGTYSLKLSPGAGKVLRLVVTAKSSAPVGTANYWPVTLTSKHDATRKDVVKASVTITS
jgi:hypothetical protein